MKEEGKEGIPSIRRLWAQDIAFQGNRGRQSRKMMEVEHSASSKCLGAFERRRETSTREERWEKFEDKMETIIEGHMNEMMRMMKTIMNQAIVKIQEDIQEVKNGEKEAKATMRAKARARAAAKARKRAKAKQRKQVKLDGDLDGSTEAEAISGGDAITVDKRMKNGDEDDSSVPVKGRDAATSIQGVELSLGGAIDGLAIYGADVYAGHKCESFTGDGTFYDANVGGDNDEKYEEDLDFSIAEASPATCESDPMFGMSFANVNIERIFLYFHYEFVKRDFWVSVRWLWMWRYESCCASKYFCE